MKPEGAISESKDIVKSNVVKVVVGSLLTVVDAGNIVDICEVCKYYKDLKKELDFEFKQEQRNATGIEQFLIDKYEAEISYCYLAGLKVGLSRFNEVLELKDNAQKAIDKFASRKKNELMTIKQ